MKTGGATRAVHATVRTGKTSFVRSSRARLALLALLLVGTLASGAQAQLDESTSGTTSTSEQSSVSDSYIVTFTAGTSDTRRACPPLLRQTRPSTRTSPRFACTPSRLPSATASAATLAADASVSRVDADQERDVATAFRTTRATPASGRCRASAGRPPAAPSRRRAPRPSRSSTPASTPRTPTSTATSSPAPRSSRRQRDERSERPRHADGRHRRRRDRQRRGHRGRRLCRRQGHARHRPRRRRHRPGLRHHRGRRLGSRSRRRRHPHVLLEPRLLGLAAGRDRLRVGAERRARRGDRQRQLEHPDLPGRRPRRHRRLEHRPDRRAELDEQLRRRHVPRRAGRGHPPASTATATITGTSASAAIVAGSAALLRASSVGASNGVIVSRLARNAERRARRSRPATAASTSRARSLDTSSDSIQPAGAAPVGGGGPFVGPYVIAAGETIEAWETTSWVGTVNGGAYTEGNVIPIRFTSDSLANGTSHTLVISYDFSNGTKRFIDHLASNALTSSQICGTRSQAAVRPSLRSRPQFRQTRRCQQARS